MPKSPKISWLKSPQKHDYPAARAYLELLLQPHEAKKTVARLKRSNVEEFAAKDILRAAQLPPLPLVDPDVKKNRQMIRRKAPLSPLLLYRDPAAHRLVIADGYHRLCAAYSFDEQASIPCKIV
jgi:hypothetical protein